MKFTQFGVAKIFYFIQLHVREKVDEDESQRYRINPTINCIVDFSRKFLKKARKKQHIYTIKVIRHEAKTAVSVPLVTVKQ